MAEIQPNPNPCPRPDASPLDDAERAGLQALLRGANECIARLSPTSARRRSVELLAEGLAEVLARR